MKTIGITFAVLLPGLFLPVLSNAPDRTAVSPGKNADTIRYESSRINKWMSADTRRMLAESMRVAYRRPATFEEIPGYDCFEEDARLASILTCAGNQLRSEDGHCTVFIPLYPPLTKEDTLYIASMKRYSPDDPLRVVDMQHMWQIRAGILHALGCDYVYFLQRRDDIDWRQYLEYYPEGKAKSIFNADTAFRVSLNLEPGRDYHYKGKYKYLDALVIQKQGRGYIILYSFFTEEGRKRMPSYWKEIEGIFRYED